MWGDYRSFGNDSTAGGFLNTTTNQDETISENKPVRRSQNVVPLVIQQIKNCHEDDFKLFGTPVQIVKLVGILKNFEVQSTKATYTIEDHTGSIKAVLWLESDGDTPTNLPNVKEESYVQLFGSLRHQNGEKTVMILRMFPISDCNIITSHLLETIYTRLSAEADSKRVLSDINVNNPGAALANSMSFVDYEMGGGGNSGLSPMQEKVFKILETDDTMNGMSRDTLYSKFPPNQHKQVNEALQFLSNEGHVYSTIDGDHFKVTTM
ncbi:replication protein A 32 kDa subunit [Diorhabda sublineata]|uniref:replication protein A 32 kDa subunit n=1 Tax=Diorhabda sublineata TaxID=1163346 RepID=UPI0024E0C32D|nr:replication protein A 32 kDa subunit [Diorhabda sublineata]